jgi:putative intracellular protease/amidase
MGKLVSLESEGYQYYITNASPKDGKVEVDALSDSRDSSGSSKDDTINLKFLQDKSFMNLLESAKKVSDFSSGEFDAIVVVVGGQGPVFTFKQETDLHNNNNKFLEFYNKGKVSAALCHGTSLLLYLKDEDDGNPLIQDKNMTGFTDEDEEEDFFSDKYVGKKAMPFRIEDEAKKLGAEFKKTNAFEPFATKDGNLITCQQHSIMELKSLNFL